jgi:tetratricopeptide (TPR) repeat protein
LTRQRLSKRQIKEDPLVTYVGKARTWTTANLRRLLIAGGVVVLVIASVSAMRNARSSQEAQASTQLSQAQYHLWGGNLQQAIDLADDIIQRWPGTRSAETAQLVRGDALLGNGDADGALAAYQAFLAKQKGDGAERSAALRGEAAALEDAGRYAEAAQRYESLARQVDQGDLVAIDLVAAARCYSRSGDSGRARALYQEVLDDYPDVQTGFDVRVKLLELGSAAGQS